MSYSADRVDGFLQAAFYIDRILRGTKPVDLPVQTPTNYELGHQPHYTVTLRTPSGSCEVARKLGGRRLRRRLSWLPCATSMIIRAAR
jgi:hypothetical protein